jgi:N-methylhydantoinase A
MITVDVGGTFTDVIAVEEGGEGKITATKIPTDPANIMNSVLAGVKEVGGKGHTFLAHATTVGLNAVITRNLPKIAFLTTLGHRDVLDAGQSWRPLEGLTDPNWRRSFGDAMRPLVPRYLRRGIRERIMRDGRVLIPLDEKQAREELEILKKCNVSGIAICLLNAFVKDEHERKLRSLVREILGDIPCSISSEVNPVAREYRRASTTVVDTFMKIIMTNYIDQLSKGLSGSGFDGTLFMADCAAGLTTKDFALERPSKIVFSGPAAGLASCAYFGSLTGKNDLVCCDIGGTSTDIGLVRDGQVAINSAFEIEHDLVVVTLASEVNTIGAGGGSIVHISQAGELLVGPESAGGVPGPMCYDRGGKQPTVTDVFLMTGVLDPSKFMGGKMPLSLKLAKEGFEKLPLDVDLHHKVLSSQTVALNNVFEGILDITVGRGIDPRGLSLVAYGSAGPMMLPFLLNDLKVKCIVVPPYPGLFSALGLVSTNLVFSDTKSEYITLGPGAGAKINEIYKNIESRLSDKAKKGAIVERTFDAMYMGQTWETPFVSIPNGEITDDTINVMVSNFNKAYQSKYGNKFEMFPVIGMNYRVRIISPIRKVEYKEIPRRTKGKPEVKKSALRFVKEGNEGKLELHEYDRSNLQCNDSIEGPAIVREPMSTTVVWENQVATVGRLGEIVIEMK